MYAIKGLILATAAILVAMPAYAEGLGLTLSRTHPVTGKEVNPTNPYETAVYVQSVEPGSVFARYRVQSGDIVTSASVLQGTIRQIEGRDTFDYEVGRDLLHTDMLLSGIETLLSEAGQVQIMSNGRFLTCQVFTVASLASQSDCQIAGMP